MKHMRFSAALDPSAVAHTSCLSSSSVYRHRFASIVGMMCLITSSFVVVAASPGPLRCFEANSKRKRSEMANSAGDGPEEAAAVGVAAPAGAAFGAPVPARAGFSCRVGGESTARRFNLSAERET